MTPDRARFALRHAFAGWLVQVAQARAAAGVAVTAHQVLRYDPHKLVDPELARCWAITCYIMVEYLGFRQAHLAQAIGISRPRVCQMMGEIRRRRDEDPTVEAAIVAVLGLLIDRSAA